MRRHRFTLTAGLIVGASLMLGCEAREVEPPGDTPPAAATDPAAESQLIRLTGCMMPDVRPGRYVLASVATGGVLQGDPEQARSWTTKDETAWTDQERAIAASTYLLIPAEEDQDLSQFENQRVTVRGMLAAEAPGRTAGAEPTTGESTEAARSTTASRVEANAPPALRGLHVEEVSKVADSCR